FEVAMEKQRETSRAANKFNATSTVKLAVDGITEFTGYTQNSCIGKIQGLFKKDGMKVEYLSVGEEGIVVLDKTVFYAESGGQVGDLGEIYSDLSVFTVQDTQKHGALYLHHGTVAKGSFALSNSITAMINEERRQAIRLNHSATHLLHAGLRFVLGDHALQRGSLVDNKKLRFDFTHMAALTAEELRELERIVNKQIRANLKVHTVVKSLEEAKKEQVYALFGEKYGDEVRVVKMGDFSKELCGGTHINATGEIGLFKIVAETSVAAGVRRIEAVTGENAIIWLYETESEFVDRLQQVLAQKHSLEKEIANLKSERMVSKSQSLIDQVVAIGSINVLATKLTNADSKTLRLTVDTLKQQLGSAVVVLATVSGDNKAQLIIGVTQDLLNKIKANELLQYVMEQIGGSGGGRADMAQGGGTNIAALESALASVAAWVKSKV
ncbi:MAG: DHHA1 domain-containing protein, partial [bacterium]